VTDHEHELDGPVTLRRQPASLSNGHREATPAPPRSRSSAANAVTIPAWITGRSHPGCARSADPTCSGPVSKRSWSTRITMTGPYETATRHTRPGFSTREPPGCRGA
jgi:hypothetical protein